MNDYFCIKKNKKENYKEETIHFSFFKKEVLLFPLFLISNSFEGRAFFWKKKLRQLKIFDTSILFYFYFILFYFFC